MMLQNSSSNGLGSTCTRLLCHSASTFRSDHFGSLPDVVKAVDGIDDLETMAEIHTADK